MAISFTRFSWWLWSGKEKESVSNGDSLNSSSDWGFGYREHDNVKFSLLKGGKIATSPRKVKRKWQSREERRIDREYDVVLVPSDGVCLSGSESDNSDWSIGWMEPHGSDFQSDDELDDSFAVLVPCYRLGCKELAKGSNNHLLSSHMSFPLRARTIWSVGFHLFKTAKVYNHLITFKKPKEKKKRKAKLNEIKQC